MTSTQFNRNLRIHSKGHVSDHPRDWRFGSRKSIELAETRQLATSQMMSYQDASLDMRSDKANETFGLRSDLPLADGGISFTWMVRGGEGIQGRSPQALRRPRAPHFCPIPGGGNTRRSCIEPPPRSDAVLKGEAPGAAASGVGRVPV